MNPICPVPPPDRQARFFATLYTLGHHRSGYRDDPVGGVETVVGKIKAEPERWTHVMTSEGRIKLFGKMDIASYVRYDHGILCNSSIQLLAYLRARKA